MTLTSFNLEHPSQSTCLLLNGVWQFAHAPDGSTPTTGWQPVRVPHRSREFESDPPISGWYRTDLRIPPAWYSEDSHIILDFGRVRHYGRAYLGEQALGEHHGMRLPWQIDLTGRIEPGASHPLVLYTHNCTGPYAHPDAQQLSEEAERALDTRFWRTSAPTVGVEDNVWLLLQPSLRIEDIYVVTSVRDKTLTVEVTVSNQRQKNAAVTLDLSVTRGGSTELELPTRQIELAPNQTEVLHLAVTWTDPILWGRPPYGRPVLYFLQAALRTDDQPTPVHTAVQRFGFREVWAEGDDLLLNGHALMPWGDHSVPYVHERQWLTRKLVDLADGNISIVEHHRLNAPSVLYDVADELGSFVVASNFCAGTGQAPPPTLPDDEMKLVMQHHLAVCRAWIPRDRNHPSILFWDVTDIARSDFAVPLLRQVKQLDATRITEVTFDYRDPALEVVELVDTYRLFSSLEGVESAITFIHSNPDTLPVKPIRVGEAGIFDRNTCPADEVLPLIPGWLDFLHQMPERKIHGLQTFFLTDMDYRDFTLAVPGALASPVEPRITWPSQSGLDARIDPFGEGGQAAWGKAALYLNWCDPDLPVSRPTATRRWSRDLFRRLTGRDVGPLAAHRVPEVIVHVTRGDAPVSHASVFVQPLQGQGVTPFGVQADAAGTSWFVLPEEGRYGFRCEGASIEVELHSQPIEAPPGYDHVHHARIEL